MWVNVSIEQLLVVLEAYTVENRDNLVCGEDASEGREFFD